VGNIEGKAEACSPHPFTGCKHRQEEGLCGFGSGASVAAYNLIYPTGESPVVAISHSVT